MKRAERIIQLYNEASDTSLAELDLNKLDNTYIIYAEGDTGGVLIYSHTSVKLHRIMFAAFDVRSRGKGLIRKCLNKARTEGLDIALVEFNGCIENEVWEYLGFDKMGTMGFSRVMTDRELSFVNYNTEKAVSGRESNTDEIQGDNKRTSLWD